MLRTGLAAMGSGLRSCMRQQPCKWTGPMPAAVSSQMRPFGDKRGSVKFFNPERGFGFIVSEGQDYFVHYTGIESAGGFRSLADGEEVEFDLEEDQSGKQRCVRVTGPGGAPVKGSTRERTESAER
eukprot:TRINITY_DN80050_c0_g1_i1.p1 TRINITY_DN80050_c0_g1~~TRINITY_DN80050_c0_g1_i1.p1  ORF type:complete len:145 (-),score=31.54 TRINITY_DN80050_c0_g1_i1:81-458(-)